MRIEHRFYRIVFSLTLAFQTHGVLAASVNIISQDRYVRSFGSVNSETRYESWSVTESSPNINGSFNQIVDESRSAGNNTSRGKATITSSIDSYLFEASGTAYGSAIVNTATNINNRTVDGNARSSFEVRFQLLESMSFDLSTLLLADIDEDGNSYAYGSAYFSLRSDYFNLTMGDTNSRSDFSQAFSLSGMLDAGVYTMSIYADFDADQYSRNPGFESGLASYDLSLQLAPTHAPLPASIWLFLSALGLIGLKSQRSKSLMGAFN